MLNRLLPWGIAGVAVVVAAVALLSPATVPPLTGGEARDCPGDRELASARRRLVTADNEAAALRTELDRLRHQLAMSEAIDAEAEASGSKDLGPEEQRARLADALERVDDLIARIKKDADPEALEGTRDVMMTMFHSPMDDPAPLLEKYSAAADPSVKAFILPHVVARLGEAGAGFAVEELGRAEDPELRAALVRSLRVHAQPGSDPAAREQLVRALSAEDDPATRRTALEALAGVRDPAVEDALLEAVAKDPVAEVREEAVRILAARPETRDRVLGILPAGDSRLRTIGECAATLASLGAAG